MLVASIAVPVLSGSACSDDIHSCCMPQICQIDDIASCDNPKPVCDCSHYLLRESASSVDGGNRNILYSTSATYTLGELTVLYERLKPAVSHQSSLSNNKGWWVMQQHGSWGHTIRLIFYHWDSHCVLSLHSWHSSSKLSGDAF